MGANKGEEEHSISPPRPSDYNSSFLYAYLLKTPTYSCLSAEQYNEKGTLTEATVPHSGCAHTDVHVIAYVHALLCSLQVKCEPQL